MQDAPLKQKEGVSTATISPTIEILRKNAVTINRDIPDAAVTSAFDTANLGSRQPIEGLEATRVANPILLDHSSGHFVALHAALRQPGLVGGLVLCDSSPTLASMDDDDGPVGSTLAPRAAPEDLAVAGRIFRREITEETVSSFLSAAVPYCASPANMAPVNKLLALCKHDIPMMRHFM